MVVSAAAAFSFRREESKTRRLMQLEIATADNHVTTCALDGATDAMVITSEHDIVYLNAVAWDFMNC